jgi:hypothetical protein
VVSEDVNEYRVDLVQVIREEWAWLGCEPVKIIDTNAFGNVIFTDAVGQYWRLIPEDLKGEVIAANETGYAALRKDEEFLIDWNMDNFCTMARKAHGELLDGKRYCFKLPPVLGYPYSAENMGVINISDLIGSAGYIGKQIKDLPDGTKVRFKFE